MSELIIEESNIIDFASSATRLMANRAMTFLMSKKNEPEKFSSLRLMGLNEGSITCVVVKDPDTSGVHLNFKFRCVECDEKIKIQYSSVSPDEFHSHWVQSICDTCYDELSLMENDDD